MAEDEKTSEYLADLERQMLDIDLALIKLGESQDPNAKVEIAKLLVKQDDLLKQRAVATGEEYEETPSSF